MEDSTEPPVSGESDPSVPPAVSVVSELSAEAIERFARERAAEAQLVPDADPSNSSQTTPDKGAVAEDKCPFSPQIGLKVEDTLTGSPADAMAQKQPSSDVSAANESPITLNPAVSAGPTNSRAPSEATASPIGATALTPALTPVSPLFPTASGARLSSTHTTPLMAPQAARDPPMPVAPFIPSAAPTVSESVPPTTSIASNVVCDLKHRETINQLREQARLSEQARLNRGKIPTVDDGGRAAMEIKMAQIQAQLEHKTIKMNVLEDEVKAYRSALEARNLQDQATREEITTVRLERDKLMATLAEMQQKNSQSNALLAERDSVVQRLHQRDAEVAALRKNVNQLTNELHTTRRQFKESEEKWRKDVVEHHNEALSARTELEKVSTKFKDRDAEATLMAAELNRLRADLDDKTTGYNAAAAEKDDVVQKLNQKLTENDVLSTKLTDALAKVKRLERSCTELEKSLETKTTQLKALQQEKEEVMSLEGNPVQEEDLKRMVSRLILKATLAENDLQALSNIKKDLEDEANSLKRSLDQQRLDMEKEFRMQMIALETELRSLREELNKHPMIKATTSAVTSSTDQLSPDGENAAGENVTPPYVTTIADIDEDNNNDGRGMARKVPEVTSKSDLVGVAAPDLSTLNSTIGQLRGSVQSIHSHHNEKIAELEAQLERRGIKICVLEDKVIELKGILEAKSAEDQVVREEIAGLQMTISQLTGELNFAKQQHRVIEENLQKQLSDKQNEVQSLQLRVNELTVVTEMKSHEIATLKENVTKVQDEFRTKDVDSSKIRTDAEVAIREAMQSKQEIQMLQSKNADYLTRLNILRDAQRELEKMLEERLSSMSESGKAWLTGSRPKDGNLKEMLLMFFETTDSKIGLLMRELANRPEKRLEKIGGESNADDPIEEAEMREEGLRLSGLLHQKEVGDNAMKELSEMRNECELLKAQVDEMTRENELISTRNAELEIIQAFSNVHERLRGGQHPGDEDDLTTGEIALLKQTIQDSVSRMQVLESARYELEKRITDQAAEISQLRKTNRELAVSMDIRDFRENELKKLIADLSDRATANTLPSVLMLQERCGRLGFRLEAQERFFDILYAYSRKLSFGAPARHAASLGTSPSFALPEEPTLVESSSVPRRHTSSSSLSVMETSVNDLGTVPSFARSYTGPNELSLAPPTTLSALQNDYTDQAVELIRLQLEKQALMEQLGELECEDFCAHLDCRICRQDTVRAATSGKAPLQRLLRRREHELCRLQQAVEKHLAALHFIRQKQTDLRSEIASLANTLDKKLS